MLRRLLFALAVLLGLIVIGSVLVVVFLGHSRIDPERFERVEAGMPRADVERLLGGPPRNECPSTAIVWVPRGDTKVSAMIEPGELGGPFFAEVAGDEQELVWMSEKVLIAVRVGPDGLVRDKYSSTVHMTARPLLGLPAATTRRITTGSDGERP